MTNHNDVGVQWRTSDREVNSRRGPRVVRISQGRKPFASARGRWAMKLVTMIARDFGGWGIRWTVGPSHKGRWGIVTQRGPGLEVVRRDGRSIVVTVDDAGTASRP